MFCLLRVRFDASPTEIRLMSKEAYVANGAAAIEIANKKLCTRFPRFLMSQTAISASMTLGAIKNVASGLVTTAIPCESG